MKKYLLILSSVLFFFFPINKSHGQDIVSNGASTQPINFPAGPCTYTWTNNNTSIGLAANGTGNIPSFTAVNTGSSPVTATIIGTPLPSPGYAYITNTGTNALSVINLSTGATVASIQVGGFPGAVAISPDGTRVYVANNTSNSVSVINAATNALIATISLGSSPAFMAMSPDGSRIYVTNQTSGTVSVIDTGTNSVISYFTVSNGDPLGILISPDGSKAYVTVTSNQVLVVNTATNAITSIIPVGADPIDIAQSPDGKLLYVSGYMGGTISVVNTSTDMVVSTIPCGSNPYGITISNDGSKLYVANASASPTGSVTIINTASGAVENTISLGFDPYGIDLSPDNSLLYVEPVNGANMVAINTANNTIVSNIPVSNPFSFGHFISAGVGCSGTPVTYTITVNPAGASLATITTTAAAGTIYACAGTASASPNIQQFTVSGIGLTGGITATAPADFEVSLAAGSGYSGSVTIPQTSGTASTTVVYVRSAASLPNGATTANVLLSSPGAAGQTVSVTAMVNPIVAASLVISASGNNICAGALVTFTATPTNGGSAPVYQWLLNGNNAGTNSPIFSSSALANGDAVNCTMTGNSACTTPSTVTSNSITMNVAADVTPSVSIAASQNTVCAGTMVTFTATPVNGGSTPVYQWLVNGNNAGTNSTTFNSSSFADGDIVSCVMTGNAACAALASATSNSITMSVSALISPAVSITASQNNICPGTNITFTATPANGGNSPVYQWLVNGNAAGTNSPTFTNSTLSNGDVISCKLTGNAACLTIADATSNAITMVVNAQVVPTVSIEISENNVCAGTPITFTASPANGGDSPSYQWLLNGNNTGTNSPTFSTNTLAGGDIVSCVVTSSSLCAEPVSATSNTITTNIFPLPFVKGGGNKAIKKGSSVALTATASGNVTDITWSPSAGLDNNKILAPQASPASTTTYNITVQTADGCMAADSVTVTVFEGITIPNTFTPNGDGVNDKWDIQNLNDYQNCMVSIFDRYGGEVYSSKGYNNPWDGTMKGRPCPVGTYYYLINRNDGAPPLSGFVALIR